MDNQHTLNNSTLEISWGAIKNNLTYFKSKLKPSTKVMLMIKASAYGNGAVELAKRLEQSKSCDYFGVAYLNEGIELRRNGIKLPILVLNPSNDSWSSIIEYSLEPEIHNIKAFHSFSTYINNSKISYPIHLKFNTGMNRLGIEENEVVPLMELIKNAHNIQISSVMTHLSSAAIESEDEFTLSQFNKFDSIIDQLASVLPEGVLIHALNSHGTERFSNYQYNMVRLGIGMYGGSSLPSLKQTLTPICKLKTVVSAVRKVRKGDSISYSRSGRAPVDGYVATLAIGYADGFNRNLGDGNWKIEINNKLYPTIGNICMDLSMIFLENDHVEIGETAILFGGQKSIHEFAAAQHTISYEAMTNIGTRVNKVILD